MWMEWSISVGFLGICFMILRHLDLLVFADATLLMEQMGWDPRGNGKPTLRKPHMPIQQAMQASAATFIEESRC